MKTFLNVAIAASFLIVVNGEEEEWTSEQYYWYNQKLDAPLNTCELQAQCLKYTITENETPTKCGAPCEYRVCWSQADFRDGWNDDYGNWGFLGACLRWNPVDFVGDMHTTGTITQQGRNSIDNFDQCVNYDRNRDGKGYWDSTCTDPQTAYGNSYGRFANVCQNVPAGHTVHFLIGDGGACTGEASKGELTDLGTTAYCAPSTLDLEGTNPGGQTYFPAHNGSGGTCSGEPAETECVWSVTVPSTCRYEEGDACDNNRTPDYNDVSVCNPDGSNPNSGSVLVYYDNDRNAAPPRSPIHDITLNGDSTVSFKVVNPYGNDLSNLYTVYPKAGGNGDDACPKQSAATDCVSDDVYTAQCLDGQTWTFVTVFVTGETASSGAAQAVNAAAGSLGTNVFHFCPEDYEPNGRLDPEFTAAFSYLIHCDCDIPSSGQRALRVSNELAEAFGGHGATLNKTDVEAKFLRGDLFGDELKMLYGLL